MSYSIEFDYQKRYLDNGLEVILVRKNDVPLVAVNIWYKVGSANESPDKTGFAHLFEHMMFQGSQHVKKEEHFKFIQEAGGISNASTSSDRTNYYEVLPSNNLELALWLESDRMGFFLPALTEEKFLNQKEVVMNERLERYDNQPYGRAFEILFSNLYPKNHPYSWPTIGWMEHIRNFELQEVEKFFRKFYVPNNATLTIVGDIDYDDAFMLVERYFGEIPPNDSIPSVKTEDFELSEKKAISHYDKVSLPRIYIAFPAVKSYAEDDAELNLLADILTSGKNSVLFKELVFEKQIAQSVTALQYSGKYGGAFVVFATAKPNIDAEELSFELHRTLKNFLARGISKEELERARNGIKLLFVYFLQNVASLADQFNHYNFYLNEPNSFSFDISRYENATVEKTQEVARKYLERNFVELRILPEGGK